MPGTASDVLIDVIHDWGVDVIFGLPGDGVDGVIEALRAAQDRIRFIHVRHEEAAAFMACAYAKFTGKLGVCLATSGPGGIHLLNGLYDAKLDGQPVLAITGAPPHDLIDTYQQQDVALDRIFEDVAIYNARVMGPTHIENVTELACRSAISKRGVAHITIPIDFQTAPANRNRTARNIPHHVSEIYAQSAHLAPEEDLQRAATLLNSGRKVVILAGQGALNAGSELEQVAEMLGAPIIKALLGKAAVPDDSPYTTGGIGLLGTTPSQNALENCDTLLIVGSSFPYVEFYPPPGHARAVQIDVDPVRIGLRFPVEVGLVGDSKRTLRGLLSLLQHNADRGFLQQAQSEMKDWWK
ncbi:MAG TPA: thiamine pyrophosphate-binding protein, partial [Chloroflexota bacterium]|nr:thiamine pyrophosphate-binding protein [Chloroflexota bacterium]